MRKDSVDLTEYLRRAVGADSRQLRAELDAADVPVLAACFKSQTALVGIARLVEKLGTLRPSHSALRAALGTQDIQVVVAWLDEHLPKRRARHDSGTAVLDDYLLRALNREELTRVETLVIDQYRVPRHLDLVTDVIERFAPATPPWGDGVLIACQHMLGSLLPQLIALMDLGIAPEHQFVMGKPYSTNRAAALLLQREGINVYPEKLDWPADIVLDTNTYEEWMRQELETMVNDAFDTARALSFRPRVVVLDDGGLLIEVVERVRAFSPEVDVVAVEQTTGGMITLADRRRARSSSSVPRSFFPVIDVAQSTAKLRSESRLIADSVVTEILRRGRALGQNGRFKHERVVVIGYGTVGSWLARQLRDNAGFTNVVIVDANNHKLSIAAANGFETGKDQFEAFTNARLVIACTGRKSAKVSALNQLLPDALLASAGSSNREFGSILPRMAERLAPCIGDTLGEVSAFEATHSDYAVNLSGKRVCLLNAGFPVNFSGAVDPITPVRIQLTRALMVAGAIQAGACVRKRSPSGGRGTELSDKMSQFIEAEYRLLGTD